MAKKKKNPKKSEVDDLDEDDLLEDDLLVDLDFDEDFEDDLDLEEELDLLSPEDLEAEIEKEEKFIDKDEEQKNLFLSCGIHIGTKLLTGDARRFIYRQTNYGLFVIDLTQTEERLKIAARFLSKYVEEGSDRVIVSSVRRYGKEPVKKFCEVLGCRAITDRFIPGSLTNPLIDDYIKDASVIVIVDPHADKVILREAQLARIPVVSLFDTDDTLAGIDLAIPANNRGKKALGLAFWLLARTIMLELGKISSEDEFPFTVEEFTSKITPVYRET
ncbi:MAG: 30S ribosomal protein S2 [Candidatus Lokiarchaeota archaeon]|nr:30S ribosomal protein S2 [Candidatus Lokiarchaeota archaeon]MBD3340724.1 30S ribosomal protein S2 [Candidatus Lokiarchaeota archaeon]